ncbi:MAG TPA: AAA family ATPase [Galbitalea sp.]|jgi:SpoVK/Ycf46/Vps4 family AAA+-type ATPase|nr:AAA family ATPase [Galbitalea sp.]
MDDATLDALRRAIEAAPEDIHLRLHLGRMLLEAGRRDDAISEAAAALHRAPGDRDARRLMADAMTDTTATPPPSPPDAARGTGPAAPAKTPTRDHEPGFDWKAAESEVEDLAGPMFVEDAEDGVAAFDVERSTLTLKDVGGMQSVKDRLTAAFLAPLRNPELRALYGKSLRGGLLMYGPPGCGKTFIARALAGELGAKFISVGISDILDPYIGVSERNVHELFSLARREAPVVVFLDEIDALGQRRSMTRNSGRNTVNQILTELDGVDAANEGVFVLAATNQPWDVDPALRRPGRFDRTILVLPPDQAAREAIFRYHLASRPVEGIDLAALARASDGLSGADIAYVCEVAAEHALTDSALSGVTRLISMIDVTAALKEVTPSISSWLDSARNVVLFGDGDGTYAELKTYLKMVKRL